MQREQHSDSTALSKQCANLETLSALETLTAQRLKAFLCSSALSYRTICERSTVLRMYFLPHRLAEQPLCDLSDEALIAYAKPEHDALLREIQHTSTERTPSTEAQFSSAPISSSLSLEPIVRLLLGALAPIATDIPSVAPYAAEPRAAEVRARVCYLYGKALDVLFDWLAGRRPVCFVEPRTFNDVMWQSDLVARIATPLGCESLVTHVLECVLYSDLIMGHDEMLREALCLYATHRTEASEDFRRRMERGGGLLGVMLRGLELQDTNGGFDHTRVPNLDSMLFLIAKMLYDGAGFTSGSSSSSSTDARQHAIFEPYWWLMSQEKHALTSVDHVLEQHVYEPRHHACTGTFCILRRLESDLFDYEQWNNKDTFWLIDVSPPPSVSSSSAPPSTGDKHTIESAVECVERRSIMSHKTWTSNTWRGVLMWPAEQFCTQLHSLLTDFTGPRCSAPTMSLRVHIPVYDTTRLDLFGCGERNGEAIHLAPVAAARDSLAHDMRRALGIRDFIKHVKSDKDIRLLLHSRQQNRSDTKRAARQHTPPDSKSSNQLNGSSDGNGDDDDVALQIDNVLAFWFVLSPAPRSVQSVLVLLYASNKDTGGKCLHLVLLERDYICSIAFYTATEITSVEVDPTAYGHLCDLNTHERPAYVVLGSIDPCCYCDCPNDRGTTNHHQYYRFFAEATADAGKPAAAADSRASSSALLGSLCRDACVNIASEHQQSNANHISHIAWTDVSRIIEEHASDTAKRTKRHEHE